MAFPLPDLDAAYRLDLVAAGRLAFHLGASRDGVASVLESFRPGPHRRSSVGTWDGVEWINDSKATNPHSAMAAIAAYPSVILIAGGRNKDLDLRGLVTAPGVKHVVAIGESAPALAVVDPGRVSLAASMADAVATADALATEGDTVLLAPGCASFDMFDDYTQRGDVFTTEVRRRKESP
jgi:UDP-N-acetylmuramoylalanine--D-glutamate ligase